MKNICFSADIAELAVDITIQAGQKGTRDYTSFFDKYNLEIVAKCRDTLE